MCRLGQTKHVIANRECGELAISEEALNRLESEIELASVETLNENDDASTEPDEGVNHGMIQASMQSGYSSHHVLSYDRYQNLYLRNSDVLKIRKGGKLEILKDDSERRVTYSSSSNCAFPHLFPNSEKSPTDFKSYTLAQELLKKTVLFCTYDGIRQTSVVICGRRCIPDAYLCKNCRNEGECSRVLLLATAPVCGSPPN